MNISGYQQVLASQNANKPNATEISSKIFGKADVNQDKSLSTDELSKMGKIGEKIATADADGDGLVSESELVTKITERMETMMSGGLPGFMNGDMPSINDIKSMMAELSSSLSDEGNEAKNGKDIIRDLLDKLQISDEESNALFDIFEDTGFSTKV